METHVAKTGNGDGPRLSSSLIRVTGETEAASKHVKPTAGTAVPSGKGEGRRPDGRLSI